MSAAVEVNLADGFKVIVLANTDKLIAESISGRIQPFIKVGTYEETHPLEINYAYGIYKKDGKESLYINFQKYYAAKGYTQFIGGTINELGMQLLKASSWKESIDIYSYFFQFFRMLRKSMIAWHLHI